jgi:outer membrane receptor protein involved in Fe transport
MKSFLLSLLSCFSIGLFAHNGSIEGIISDADKRLELTGVSVQLRGAVEMLTFTNELGYFAFRNLPAGNYQLSISSVGFANQTLSNVSVVDGVSTPLKISLEAARFDLPSVQIQAKVDYGTQVISKLDLQTRPLTNAQEILPLVPGLFIAQHAGGGKAEQIFLRGFDIDHGTDINLSVDGMPVNMVSHAHGQGYADLHFIIPEMVDRVDYKKGPYFAQIGNFGTAGAAQFITPGALDRSFVKVEAGQFDSYRLVNAWNIVNQEKHRAYLASELSYSNGYFDAPQYFNRRNLMGKYTFLLSDRQSLSVSFSSFSSTWDASGQIPERAVAAGSIGRFGAIDPTEGGRTSRDNLSLTLLKTISPAAYLKSQLYLSRYRFELYSNFTFFERDPVNGDQIRQKENRQILGYNGALHLKNQFLSRPYESEFGLNLRYDQIEDNELSYTKNRETTLENVALGNIQEGNYSVYYDGTLWLSPAWNVNAGLRYDQFYFRYDNLLETGYNPQAVFKGRFSPKFNLTGKVSEQVQIFVNAGYGFHSNDTRVVVAQGGQDILPKAFGAELGANLKASPTLLLQGSLWHLDLDQEFVYVGDEGIVEPSGRTRRRGVDIMARWQLRQKLFVDANVNYAFARSRDEEVGNNYIPLAPDWTSTGGVLYEPNQKWQFSLRYRYLDDRAANEDKSLIAGGYFLLDGVARYRSGNFELGLTAQNLLNRAWKEAQFETTSRLRTERDSITEIHYTPGTPRNLRVYFMYRF